ncbi:PucR family transcriptional regulator [Jatrophihabitans sp. YIM 134969]
MTATRGGTHTPRTPHAVHPPGPRRPIAPAPQIPDRLTTVEWPTLPRRWTATILPAELPSLTREIVTAIRTEIPEYRRAMDGVLGRSTRRGVEQALAAFLLQVVSGRTTAEHDDVFRSLGRMEALEGRPHDVLQAAYRVGSMVAWRRITALQERAPLPPDTVARLAAALFAFIDRLAGLSAQGYQEAQLTKASQAERLRVRLAKMLLDQPATSPEGIESLADRIGWELPDRVQVVELRDAGHLDVDLTAVFGYAVLSYTVESTPVLIAPAPLDDAVVATLNSLPPDVRVLIGPPLPLVEAPRSLQWAQLADRLRLSDVIPDDDVLHAEEHLPTLLVMAQPAIADLLVARRLGPLMTLSAPKRLKYARLLSAWLERGGSQADVADSLGLHRQTAHYQFARLTEMFGPCLQDRDARVEMALALRAVMPNWESVDGIEGRAG